jgi:deoxycytidylate deaminase
VLPVRPDWDEYFWGIAREVSTRATCPRASIGVVIVSKDHHIISTGFNGAPSKEPHCTEVGCLIFANHCVRARHGEVNAIEAIRKVWGGVYAGNPSREDQTLIGFLEPTAYVVGPRDVCSNCARTLYEAGVKEVKCLG